jgi:hypothetical protein
VKKRREKTFGLTQRQAEDRRQRQSRDNGKIMIERGTSTIAALRRGRPLPNSLILNPYCKASPMPKRSVILGPVTDTVLGLAAPLPGTLFLGTGLGLFLHTNKLRRSSSVSVALKNALARLLQAAFMQQSQ